MRNTLMDTRRARPSRRVAAFARLAATMALAVLGLGALAQGSRAETLRWKLNPGEVLRYNLEEKLVSKLTVMGREKKSNTSQTLKLSWNVKSISATGDIEVTNRVDRVRMRIDQPPFVPMDFDSDAVQQNTPDEFEAVAKQIKATAGAEFSFVMKPTGEIAEIKFPEQTLKRLREGVPAEMAGQGMFSEQGLKDMLLQSSLPPFPAESLEPGKTWSGKASKLTTPLGTLMIDKVFTLQGPDPKTPKLLLVGMEARVSLMPAENVTAKIRAQEGKGSLIFDSLAGRIVSSRGNQKMELVITDRGQEIIQTTETTSTMTLEP
jgi:hypothetical protein